MTFWQGLLAGRSHLAFLGGLALALAIGLAVERRFPDEPRAQQAPASDTAARFQPKDPPQPRAPGTRLSEQQRALAQAAWAYFEHNTQPSGLVDSVEKFPATTLWDLGSALMGMLGAQRLGLITRAELVKRAGKLLDALSTAPLLAAGVPNKSYDTRTLAMTNYDGTPAPRGIGWSAIDLARFAVPLTVLAWQEPELTPRIRALLAAWKLDVLAAGGELQTGDIGADGAVRTHQEGRLGYEQYAAQSLALLGVDTSRARSWTAHLTSIDASGVRVPADDREPARHAGTSNAVTSEPFVLLGAEMGLEAEWLPLAQSLLAAQQARKAQTGQLTAVSEDHLDRAPHFVYFSVSEGGRAWVARTPDGRDASDARTVSTKAALGWGTLFAGPYADELAQAALGAVEPERGVYSGRYEGSGELNRALTSNTAGIVLELLAAQVQGPWLRAARASEANK